MDPLSTVENILGSIETWPSAIIVDLFITKPCTMIVQNVAAFMYGNFIPVEKAVLFYCVCWNRKLLCIMCCEGLVHYMG